MKKFKFNFKLTLFLVSLFIGLVLVILGNKVKLCLSFGLILMGVSMGFYALFKTDTYTEEIQQIDQAIEEMDEEESQFELMEIAKLRKRVQKQKGRMNLIFCLTGVLLIVFGFCVI